MTDTLEQHSEDAVSSAFKDEVIAMAFEVLPDDERGEGIESFKSEFTEVEFGRLVKFADYFYQRGMAARNEWQPKSILPPRRPGDEYQFLSIDVLGYFKSGGMMVINHDAVKGWVDAEEGNEIFADRLKCWSLLPEAPNQP